MFCPKCRVEYREGFTRCSDCGSDLVPECPPADEPEYVERVTVFEGDPNDAAVARATLESAGIESTIRDEEVQSVFPNLGPVEVQVKAEDEEAALEALADAEDAAELAEEEEDAEE